MLSTNQGVGLDVEM